MGKIVHAVTTASTAARATLTPSRWRFTGLADLLDEDEDEEQRHRERGGEDADAPVDLADLERVAVSEGGQHVGGIAGAPPVISHTLVKSPMVKTMESSEQIR